MGKVLIITEKPSVARDIGKVLKCTKRGDGYIFSNDYIISWAVGHLVSLCEPEDYDKIYKKWTRESLPIIPKEMKLKAVPNTRSQLIVLHKLVQDKDVSSIICATDSGREGELIFRYIYNITKSDKPFQRLWISSMTDEAIKEGFKNLKDGKSYDNLYYSAKCRNEADWLVGINATRAFTIEHNVLLSVGRVQTPTLAIIVNRHLEIENFVSQPYFELDVVFAFENSEYVGKWYNENEESHKLDKKEDADVLEESIKDKIGVIHSVTSQKKNIKPPLLYDLTELQRDCNNKFGFSAKQTLDIAQSLYERKKVITYPRTDSRYLSKDMKSIVEKTINSLKGDDKLVSSINEILAKPLKFTKRIINDAKVTDHHAIIPTGKTNSQLDSNERKVFYLIVQRFFAVFYPDYIYNSTKMITKIDEEVFVSKGQVVVSLGWKKLYEKGKNKNNEDEENDKELPKLKKGDKVNFVKSEVLEKKTSPPSKYNEASLLGSMENAGKHVEDEELREQLKDGGIGTPATRAGIIERLLQVGYITRKGKTLEPTEKGIKLIAICPDELKSPSTTGKWERALNKISKGDMEPEKFMESINRYVAYLVASTENHAKVEFPEENRGKGKTKGKAKGYGKCPVCEKGEIYENSKSFFCSRWKYGCKFNIWKNVFEKNNIEIDSALVKTLLKDKIVKDVNVVMPDTKEKAVTSIGFDDKFNLNLVNLKVFSNFENNEK
ncbi:MAG: DNA topoisomerase III [Lachnospirales bacterium]